MILEMYMNRDDSGARKAWITAVRAQDENRGNLIHTILAFLGTAEDHNLVCFMMHVPGRHKWVVLTQLGRFGRFDPGRFSPLTSILVSSFQICALDTCDVQWLFANLAKARVMGMSCDEFGGDEVGKV
jgi:hypothetical protein